jgi:two-component system, NarL family, sensor kinase
MQTLDQAILIVISSSIFILALVIAFLLFVNAYIKRNASHKLEKLKLQSAFEQALLQAQIEISEKTLNHVSSELHDNIGQIASLLKINLLTLQLDSHPKMVDRLNDSRELVRRLITDVKFLSLSLNSERISEMGLIRGLENELDMINKSGQFNCNLFVSGELPRLNGDTTTILFRMSQEILHNIVKHSRAKTINVYIENFDGVIKLRFKDDGVGFNVQEALVRGGSGLFNLNKRAKLINAILLVDSKANSGTEISLEINCHKQ